MKRPTQRDMVLRVLQDGASHPKSEFYELGIHQVAARIHELRREGHQIETRRIDRPGCSPIFEYQRVRPLTLPIDLAGTHEPLVATLDEATSRTASRELGPERGSRLVTGPICGTSKRVATTIGAGLVYLSCGLHFIPCDELQPFKAAGEETAS